MPVFCVRGKRALNKYSRDPDSYQNVLVRADSKDDAREVGRNTLAYALEGPIAVTGILEIDHGDKTSVPFGLDYKKPWYAQRLVFFDLETTGLTEEDRIIEIGLAVYNTETKQFEEAESTYVNPEGRESHPKAQEVHQIDPEMLEEAPMFAEVVEDVLAPYMEDTIWIAHNYGFDWSFFVRHLKAAGYDKPLPPCLCSYALATVTDCGQEDNKLNTLSEHFDVKLENHHKAIDDALAGGNVFMKLARKNASLRNAKTTREIIAYFDAIVS